MSSVFKIYGAYEWSNKGDDDSVGDKKNTTTPKVMKEIVSRVQKQSTPLFFKNKINIQYNRLRATAGGFLFETISNRIRKADAVIFDITNNNPNVMFELGIALEANKNSETFKIYLIHEGDNYSDVKLPSDLQGFYYTLYSLKGNKIILHDSQSIVMRLKSEIAEKFNISYYEDEAS
jgi:hypothetical protein